MSAARGTDVDWRGHRPLVQWLATGERGISSDTIVWHLTGVTHPGRPSHPWDPDDFRRCELLLQAVPMLRLLLPGMVTLSPQWARLVERWDEINTTCAEECDGEWPNGAWGAAPKGYALIKECIQEETRDG